MGRHSGSMALVALLLLVAGCRTAPAGSEAVRLELWSHGGTPAEAAALQRAVAGFESEHPGWDVRVTTVAEGDYNDRLQAAVATGDLPDVVDVDGPLIASWAHQGALEPLDDLLPDDVIARMLPSLTAQGTWQGQLWAVGAFDSGLGLYADRAALRAAGVDWPTSVAEAWTATEFDSALAALARRDPDRKVLDLKLNYGTGEWLSYGFVPLLSSAGAAVVDPKTGRAAGVLDAPAAVAAMRALAGWARYAEPNADDKAFVQRRVALSWVGHWVYADYAAALGDDLLLLPLPDLGLGSKSGQGSWAWAVGAGTSRAQEAAQLLSWLVADPQVLDVTTANGGVPGTSTALAQSAPHRKGGPLNLYAEQLVRTCGAGPVSRTCVSVPRPITPGYPAVTTAVSLAIHSVLGGEDPAAALTRAVRAIDADVDTNDGYR